MDPIGQAFEFTAPIYFPPPPKTFDHPEPGTSWISAEAKGFTDKTFSTSELDCINDVEANRALMIRFFRTMNIKHADVLAVWPPQSTLTKEGVRNKHQKATRYRTAIGNKFLFTDGKSFWLTSVRRLKEVWTSDEIELRGVSISGQMSKYAATQLWIAMDNILSIPKPALTYS